MFLASDATRSSGSAARGQIGGQYQWRRPARRQRYRTASKFPLYEEEAEIRHVQDLGGGGLFDIGAAYRVGKQWGVGIAFNKTGDRGDATVDGSLPNPLYFNRPRTFATTAVAGLKHDENAWHFQAAWFMPYTDKIDFLFTGGPTIFNDSTGVRRRRRLHECRRGL